MTHCRICGMLLENLVHKMFHMSLTHYSLQTAIGVTLLALMLPRPPKNNSLP